MSKKKSISRSTMTLKDFHGGSIPSDLLLPSAPGIATRPSDRSGFDRQMPSTSWGNPIGRPDHRSRPGSSGTTRSFDEKAAFLSQPPQIGRNFDEDERKPFDGGVSATSSRRLIREDDTVVRLPSIGRSDPNLKPDSGMADSVPLQAPGATSFSTMTSVKAATVANSRNFTSSGAPNVAVVSAPNAWGTRKDVVESQRSVTLTGPSAVSKFAQASALEKISSGRWQSKPAQASVNHHVPDVEVISHPEVETCDIRPTDQVNSFEYYGVREGRREGSVRDFSDGGKDRNLPFHLNGVRPAFSEDKLSGLQFQSELQEKTKFNCLPSPKPLETVGIHVRDYKEVYEPPAEVIRGEAVNEVYGNANTPHSGSGKGLNHNAFERPKLNLKPRSQTLENSVVDRERNTVFGGARPRELVLKERGFDDVIINNLSANQPVNRVKQDVLKAETKLEGSPPAIRHGERPENLRPDLKVTKELERKDHWSDSEKSDAKRGSWKNDSQKNISKDFGRAHGWRQEDAESWRKPSQGQGRYGKTASALELAQAFSSSASDLKPRERFTGQRNASSRSQVPFSRLTDSHSGLTQPRQINGY